MIIRLLIVCLASAIGMAGEAVVSPEPPYLGVDLEVVADAPPLRVARVVPGATADRLGLKPGDRLTAIAGTPVATMAEVAAAVVPLVPGAALPVTVVRDGQTVALEGTVEAVPRPRQLLTDADKLRGDIARLKEGGERERMQSDLQDSLRLLTRLQEGLPKMAEDFKRVYPTGTFAVQIHIDIRSEPAALVQVPLTPTPTPTNTPEKP